MAVVVDGRLGCREGWSGTGAGRVIRWAAHRKRDLDAALGLVGEADAQDGHGGGGGAVVDELPALALALLGRLGKYGGVGGLEEGWEVGSEMLSEFPPLVLAFHGRLEKEWVEVMEGSPIRCGKVRRRGIQFGTVRKGEQRMEEGYRHGGLIALSAPSTCSHGALAVGEYLL